MRRTVGAATAAVALLLAGAPLAVAGGSGAAARATDPAGWVDPFVGTAVGTPDFGTGGGAGNTFPGATVPFGMLQWSPDTLQNDVSLTGGYGYDDTHITGFGLTHMSGAGCAVYRDLPFLPTTSAVTASPARFGSADLVPQFEPAFDHRHERAAPGFYRVTLDPGTTRAVDVALSATTRTGAGVFTFRRAPVGTVLVNAGGSAMADAAATVHVDPARREVSGSAQSGRFCYQGGDYTVYFVAVFDRPFADYGTWQREVLLRRGVGARDVSAFPENYGPVPGGPKHLSGDPSGTAQAGAYVSFDTRRRRTVQVRVGLSFVSVADARRNLAAEQPHFDFGRVRRAARGRWDGLLARAWVAGGPPVRTRLFYTALYHALLSPRTFSDVDGSYPGMDGRVHVARGYTQYADFSGWDVYRTQVPLLALFAPRVASDVVRSLLADAAQSGSLPKWPFADEQTEVMTGDPADLAIAATWAMGARGFDRRAAVRAMVHGATTYGVDVRQRYVERPGLVEYERLGYVPAEEEDHLGGIATVADPAAVWGPASTTLEYAAADHAVGVFARSAGLASPATEALLRRGGSWRALWNPATGYLQPRSVTGEFLPGFSPTSGDGWVEGDAAQYTWAVPQDPVALVALMGGRRRATQRLQRFLRTLNGGPSAATAYLGDEPTLHTPLLFDVTGAPWLAQQVVRRALLTLYADRPSGMPGNDDLGTMSAWWVLCALGVYPVDPAAGVLEFASPLFPRVRLDFGGHVLTVSAPGAAGTPYVAGLTVDGRPWERPWLPVPLLLRGGSLAFTMSSRPTGWGSAAGAAPPSG